MQILGFFTSIVKNTHGSIQGHVLSYLNTFDHDTWHPGVDSKQWHMVSWWLLLNASQSMTWESLSLLFICFLF